MVTHSSTSRPVQCLCMAERTGCPVLTDLWSYVLLMFLLDIITRDSKSACGCRRDKTARRSLRAENTQHVVGLVFSRAVQRRLHESITVPCGFRVSVSSLNRLSSPKGAPSITRVRVGVATGSSRHAINLTVKCFLKPTRTRGWSSRYSGLLSLDCLCLIAGVMACTTFSVHASWEFLRLEVEA